MEFMVLIRWLLPGLLSLFPGLPTSPTTLMAAATALAVGLVAIAVYRWHAVALDESVSTGRLRPTGRRDRFRRTAFLRLRDPDAAGRTRSRAPSRGLLAA